MHKAIFGLGFFLLIACSGQSSSDESNSGAAAASGEEANGGSGDTDSGGTGGGARSGAGGTATGGAGGASPSGGSPGGGAATGGSTASGGEDTGEGGEAGAAAGGAAGMTTGGSAGTGGQSAGSGGGSSTDARCDPSEGELETTPYPDCEPRDLNDACELCIQAECCAESKVCYGYEPGNVCGWGGPTSGAYAGLNEIDCYVACVRDYVSEYGAYDDAADSGCVPACTTPSCGLMGKATQELVVCLRAHCDDDCFLP